MREGTHILNFLVVMFIIVFTLLNYLYWGPILKALISEDTTFNGSFAKQHICSMDLGQHEDFYTPEQQLTLSTKPKLIIWSIGRSQSHQNQLFEHAFSVLIFLFYVIWMFRFSLRDEKRHTVLTYQRNLYTLRHQAIIEISLLVYLFLDQWNTKFCEVFFPSLGPLGTFQVWWSIHFVEKILVLFVKNCSILYFSYKHYPELYGYEGNTFPHQQGPRMIGL